MCYTFIRFYFILKTTGLVNLIITIVLFKNFIESKLYLYITDYIKNFVHCTNFYTSILYMSRNQIK